MVSQRSLWRHRQLWDSWLRLGDSVFQPWLWKKGNAEFQVFYQRNHLCLSLSVSSSPGKADERARMRFTPERHHKMDCLPFLFKLMLVSYQFLFSLMSSNSVSVSSIMKFSGQIPWILYLSIPALCDLRYLPCSLSLWNGGDCPHSLSL